MSTIKMVEVTRGEFIESMKYYSVDMKKEVLEKDKLKFKLMELSD